jgi:predicted transcriptional regulator
MVGMNEEQVVEMLARRPLMLSILKVVSNSEKGETPSSVAVKLNKLTPNVARIMSNLNRMGVLRSERMGKRKLYSVPEAKRNEIKAIIKQAVADGVSDARSRLTESFYQNSLYTSLTTLVPDGWKVSTNVKLQSGAAMLNLDLTISDDKGRVAGVELNMGPPGQHLYAVIGKALVSGAKQLQMLILVLLATHAKDYEFLKQIRSANSRPRFGVILREMPVESETTFAEGVAKEIINTIRSSR